MPELMRLDKYLSVAGEVSRSQVRALIVSGAVTVDGVPVTDPARKVDADAAEVMLQGERLVYRKYIYIMLNKPAGVLSATFDRYRPTVVDLLEGAYPRRDLAPVGRLDEDTTGLILLSDDGPLAHFLLSPRHHVPKRYRAQLTRPVSEEDIQKFSQGMELSDFHALPAQLIPWEGNSAEVVLNEGKYHQVKRMFVATGNEVTALKRIAFGPLTLDPNLTEGQWRELDKEEIDSLRAAARGTS